MKDKAEQLFDDIINAWNKQGHYADRLSVGLILQAFREIAEKQREACFINFCKKYNYSIRTKPIIECPLVTDNPTDHE